MKFRPPDLPAQPTTEQWQWWKRCFSDGLLINEITEDAHKLTFLRAYAGSELFAILERATTFDDAMQILDAQFLKPTRVLYARHQVISCRQKDNESVSDFLKRLRILVERCECQDLDAQLHKDVLLRDGFVAGPNSDTPFVLVYWNWTIKKPYWKNVLQWLTQLSCQRIFHGLLAVTPSIHSRLILR